jgi:hypothetical protein
VVTVIGIGLADLLVGAPLTETVFAWPGLGRLLVTAVGQRDLPVVMGAVLLFALVYVLGNLLVDLAPTWPSTRGCAMPARRGPRRHRGFLLGLALLALLAPAPARTTEAGDHAANSASRSRLCEDGQRQPSINATKRRTRWLAS